jgi:hypothetical protein
MALVVSSWLYQARAASWRSHFILGGGDLHILARYSREFRVLATLATLPANSHKENGMQGFYGIYYTGLTGAAAFGLLLHDGRVYSVDAAGGDVSGT